ncbi:glutathione S-transferase [Arthroderma uncinatum]|uniref:glutathione S-transferase n=1 Tax=Arthroderma uncinatum TaxID=74035 RepID=UPI00144AF1A2|nr:glutathione S-transferase [Arthroderma uncinatum]KAF3481037.1 glutathione S-transferase [Arthroderma uncinatum]
MADDNRKDVKVTLYWLEKSRAQRILWLLEELKLPYELKRFKRDKDLLADPKLKEVHPLGRSPVISLEAPALEKPLVLAESGFIVEYLTEHFGPALVPKRYRDGCEGAPGGETESWLRNKYFVHYAEGSLMPLFLVQLVVNRIRGSPVPFFLKPITRGIADKIEDSYLKRNIKLHLDFLEDQLKTSPDGGRYICGDELSGADIMMSFLVEAASASKAVTEESHPALGRYLAQLKQREAYKKAVDLIVELEGSCEVIPR